MTDEGEYSKRAAFSLRSYDGATNKTLSTHTLGEHHKWRSRLFDRGLERRRWLWRRIIESLKVNVRTRPSRETVCAISRAHRRKDIEMGCAAPSIRRCHTQARARANSRSVALELIALGNMDGDRTCSTLVLSASRFTCSLNDRTSLFYCWTHYLEIIFSFAPKSNER